MTKFNACATYRGSLRAKTMQRPWTPALHQYVTWPPLIRSSRGWSHTRHRTHVHPLLQYPVNFPTTHLLIVNYQNHPILPLIYLHPHTHYQPTQERQPPTTRPPTTQLQIMTAGIGTTTPIGTTQHTPVATVVHLTMKVTLETIIAKDTLAPTIRHTTPPDHAGKHYITAEHLAIRQVSHDSGPVSLVAPTDSFGATMLLPTFGIWDHIFRQNVCDLLPAHRPRSGFTWCFTQTWVCHIMFHTFLAVWPFRITFSPLPQILFGLLRLFRPIILWILSTSWLPRTWSLSLAKIRMWSLLHNRTVRAHPIDLTTDGTRRYLLFADRCTLQWPPLVLLGILLAYLLHRRRLHCSHRAQHGFNPHHLFHLHRRRFLNNLSTTPISHLNDILLPRDRRDLCHPLEEALPSMKATPVDLLKSHRLNNGNLTSTSMTPTKSTGWISLPGSAKADSLATKTLKVWIPYKSHSGSFCTKAYTIHGSAVLPTDEKLSSSHLTT